MTELLYTLRTARLQLLFGGRVAAAYLGLILFVCIAGVAHAGPTHELVAGLAEFTNNGESNKGANPYGDLVSDGAGFLWGTTRNGGANNFETVFKVNASSGALTTVIEFTGNGAKNKGAAPVAGLVSDGGGSFWGTTSAGGAYDYGTIFKLNASTGALTTVVEFTDDGVNNKGATPFAGLVSDGAGSFWGTTRNGGAYNYGTVFKVNASTGALTTVVEFTWDGARNKGANPYAGLVSDGAGSFWGTTYYGGALGPGTIFKVDVGTGVLTTVVEFTRSGSINRGANPTAGLVSDGAGSFWGTTEYGGKDDCGTVFSVNAGTGALTTRMEFRLLFFGNICKGLNPLSGFVSDGAGFLWGTTTRSVWSNYGTVFKVNASTGAPMDVLEFSGNEAQANSGKNPGYGALFKHTDGNIYGTTIDGGPGRGGTIFRLRFGPTPVTQAASEISLTGVTLNGTVNPNNDGTTAVSFQYGTSPDLSDAVTVSAGTVSNGTSASPVSATLTGLSVHMRYYYRLVASNAGNSIPQQGEIVSFTPLNKAPVAPDGVASATSGDAKTITLPFAATDADGDSVTLASVTAGVGLTVNSFSGSSVTFTPGPGFAGTSSLSYTVEDGFGGTATGTITVSVADNDAPVFSGVPANITVNAPANATTAVVTWAAPIASDNVGVSSMTSTHSPGATFPVGVTTVTYTAKDAAGNTATAGFTVTVLDELKPVISGMPGNLTVSTPQGAATAVASWTEPSASDNVGVASFTSTHVSGSAFPVGVTTVTYTAKDAAGNTATANFTVTVLDGSKPVFSNVPTNIAVNILANAAAAVVNWAEPSVSDNVGGSSVTSTHSPGASFPVGTTTVTYTARDAAGNIASASFTVSVEAGKLVIEQLFTKGAAVPGAGVPGSGIPAGAIWNSFGVPAINGSGELAFVASLTLSPTDTLTGIFAGPPQAPALLVKKGDAAPGTDGAVFASFKDPLFNEAGRVAFVATIYGVDVTGANNCGIWTNMLGADAAGFQLVARKGGSVPGVERARWKSFSSVALASGELNLFGTMASGVGGVSAANDLVLCRYGAGAPGGELLLREGQQLSIDGVTGKLKSFAALATVSGSPGQRRQPLEGGLHVRATLSDGRTCLLNNIGVAGLNQLEAVTGDAVVDQNSQPAGKLASLGLAADASGSAWGSVFRAALKGAGASGVNNAALVGASADGVSILARKGEEADTVRVPGALIKAFASEPVASEAGYAAVVTLSGEGISKARDTALFWRGNGFSGLLAREGDPAPGASGALYGSIVSVALPDGAGGPIFVAKLLSAKTSPVGRVTARNDLGLLWVADSSGAVRLLLREGDPLDGKIVTSFVALPVVLGSAAQARSYNDAGTIAVKVTFSDGSQAIVRLGVP